MGNRTSNLWVPASEHQAGVGSYGQQHEDEEEEEEEDEDVQTGGANGETRGREEERNVAA